MQHNTDMRRSFDTRAIEEIESSLGKTNKEFAASYPGDLASRQPVHTVYGGAQIFSADLSSKLGATALKSLQDYAPTPSAFARAVGMEGKPAHLKVLYSRILHKLKSEPVEDYRIDFEDGYGNRADDEEDRHAFSTGQEMARGLALRILPPFIGIRVKPFTEEFKTRSVRTIDIFLSSLVDASGGRLPDNFVVTLPKVTAGNQVAALARIFDIFESKNNLRPGTLKLEIMVETPQSIFDRRGNSVLPSLVDAGRRRCVAAHFGVYDYTALLNITAAYQTMDHPACDFARQMMKVSLAGTGVWLSDGATNVLPVGPHRPGKTGKPLSSFQRSQNRTAVYRAWRLAFEHTTNSLVNGIYQGWDLHPAQLPVRYAAVYSFFLRGLEPAAFRLRTFIEKAAQATLIGDVMDDAATGQGLLNFFLRGISCGAITEQEALSSGLTIDEIRSRSFLKILKGRL